MTIKTCGHLASVSLHCENTEMYFCDDCWREHICTCKYCGAKAELTEETLLKGSLELKKRLKASK